jgi:hypothetical protein
MMIFALLFVWSPKKFNVHLCQKVPFVLVCFQVSAAPRPEISDSDKKDALFDLDYYFSFVLFNFEVYNSNM